MSKKTLFAILAVFVAAATVLSACGPAPVPVQEPVTVVETQMVVVNGDGTWRMFRKAR